MCIFYTSLTTHFGFFGKCNVDIGNLFLLINYFWFHCRESVRNVDGGEDQIVVDFLLLKNSSPRTRGK